MERDLAERIQEIEDRAAIYDCIMRYCRGVDRLDRDILLSAYHPDGIDDHGTFVGPIDAFADYVFDLHTVHQHRTQHHITNHRCEINGDVADCESYFVFRSLNKAPPLYTMASGRYLDRIERRDGRWAIAKRVCIVEIRNEHWAPTGFEGDSHYQTPLRDRNDPSYRELLIPIDRFTSR